MKVKVEEFESCFGIDLEPENLEDATFLIRMGINATKEVRSVNACAEKNSGITGYVVLGKRKIPSSQILKAR